jgi:hypothetical protein
MNADTGFVIPAKAGIQFFQPPNTRTTPIEEGRIYGIGGCSHELSSTFAGGEAPHAS